MVTMGALHDKTSMMETSPNKTTVDPDSWRPDSASVPATHLLIFVVLGLASLLGIIANSTVIIIFRMCKTLRSTTNLLVEVLSYLDLAMSIFGLPIASISALMGRFVWDFPGFIIYGFVMTYLGLSNINVLTAISVERYTCIVHPVRKVHLSPRVTWLAIVLCLLLPLVWSIAPLCGWNNYALEGLGFSASVNWAVTQPADVAYICLLFICSFFIPLILICYSYAAIIREIRSLTRNATWGPEHYLTRKNLKIEVKMVKTTLAIVASFLVAWLPYAIVSFMTTIRGAEAVHPLAGTMPAVLAKCSCVLNPLLYVGTNSQFRYEFGKLLCDWRSPSSTEGSGVDSLNEGRASSPTLLTNCTPHRTQSKAQLPLTAIEEQNIPADSGNSLKSIYEKDQEQENKTRLLDKDKLTEGDGDYI